jgi:hypothetical protein
MWEGEFISQDTLRAKKYGVQNKNPACRLNQSTNAWYGIHGAHTLVRSGWCDVHVSQGQLQGEIEETTL